MCVYFCDDVFDARCAICHFLLDFKTKAQKCSKLSPFEINGFLRVSGIKLRNHMKHVQCTLQMRLHFHWRFVWKHAVCLFEYVYMAETRQFYCLVLHTLFEYRKCFERSFFTHLVSLFSSAFSSIILAVFSSFFSIFSFSVCLSNQNELNTFEMQTSETYTWNV